MYFSPSSYLNLTNLTGALKVISSPVNSLADPTTWTSYDSAPKYYFDIFKLKSKSSKLIPSFGKIEYFNVDRCYNPSVYSTSLKSLNIS